MSSRSRKWENGHNDAISFVFCLFFLLTLYLKVSCRTSSVSEMLNRTEPELYSCFGWYTADAWFLLLSLNLNCSTSRFFWRCWFLVKNSKKIKNYNKKKSLRFLFCVGVHTCSLSIYSIRRIVVLSTGSWWFIIKMDESPILVNKNLFLVIV